MKNRQSLEQIILLLLTPGDKPADVFRKVRAAAPEATKKEIIHASFSAMLTLVESDPDMASALQDFALRVRKS